MKKLNVGIIGLGVGRHHVLSFGSHPQCRVISLCDFSSERLKEMGREFPHIQTTENAEDILTDPGIDIVSIASFDNYHFSQTVEALHQNKHVFVEKPLCLFREEAAGIRDLLWEKQSLLLSSNLNLRTCPRFKWVRSTIRSGEMGQIFYIGADYLWGRIQKLTHGWRKEMPYYSILYGAAVHMIDLVIWLLGEKPVEVQGYGNHIATEGSDFRHNDFAALLLKFGNGIIANINANGGCVHPHFHKLSVYGTQGTFAHDINGAWLFKTRDPDHGAQEIMEAYPGEDKHQVIHSFVDAIVNRDVEPLVPADDIFTVMSICFAAEDSVTRNIPVSINYI